MSFIERNPIIKEGDTVILFLSVNNHYPIEVTKYKKNKSGNYVENKFQTIYGHFDVMELVGKKYGTKFHLPRGWAYVLHPTCELWTKTLPHRTQIIYTPDISLIIFGLDLAPGSIVIEAGTGSGSLSHAFIRTVYPTGHLYTFDFHEKRADQAREEFQKHGLNSWVTVGHRDVISDGFDVEKPADAVFLDLPKPWEVVPHVQRSLKRGGKLCTFSPCIEQVQKTVEALKRSGEFVMIKTQEVLQRSNSIQYRILTSLDFSLDEAESASGKLVPIKKEQCKFRTLIPPPQSAGHTGYITFATFVPGVSSS
ncbi:tRNA (adenine(58)-N(1))-methyltransferase catalytic subunit TRMT61A [Orchesella cincta]|uniref:tRNA (adenine(58)-N(1))-methyltransferase catalytic subunit TRMT61A n=1 Tax=Orchesella cincta TaxID=48709 RepID=A0A1D2MW63_ORCCI|nr:tRNA (adenine(58)-N(1))-methyltransferase catalytic subunit TRMT61A [Orchesella cincta]